MKQNAQRLMFGRYDYAAFQSFFAYSSATVVLPVALVALSRDLGFDLEEGGLSEGGALHFGRTFFVMLSMLFCGVFAGRWGKRKTMGVATLLMGAGGLLCAATPSYSLLFLALMVAGLGEGIIEGLATPFVSDLHPEEPGRYINFAHSFWSIGVLTTVLVSGGLLALGVPWRPLVGGVALLAFIGSLLLLMPERKKKYPEHPEPIRAREIWARSKAIFAVPRFWLFFAAMFCAGGGEFCLTFWSASHIQLNFGASAWAGGFGTACFAAGMVLGRTGWAMLLKQHHLKHLVFFSAVVGALIAVPFPRVQNLWTIFGLLFAMGIAVAPFWPSVQSYCADRLRDLDTTMLFILLSCAGIPGCGFFTWLMGFIGNRTGDLATAFYLVPICFLTLAALIGYDWITSKTKGDGSND